MILSIIFGLIHGAWVSPNPAVISGGTADIRYGDEFANATCSNGFAVNRYASVDGTGYVYRATGSKSYGICVINFENGDSAPLIVVYRD